MLTQSLGRGAEGGSLRQAAPCAPLGIMICTKDIFILNQHRLDLGLRVGQRATGVGGEMAGSRLACRRRGPAIVPPIPSLYFVQESWVLGVA